MQRHVLADSTINFDFEIKYHTYNANDDIYWCFVNAIILSHSLRLLFQAPRRYPQSKDGKKSFFSITLKEFFRDGEMVSLLFYFHEYWCGSAHPTHGVFTQNFGGRECGHFSLRELLNSDEREAERLITYCKKNIYNQLMANGDPEPDLSVLDTVDRWSLLSQFNFSEAGLTINFSPYDILPYVFGEWQVAVPWSFVSCDLADEFDRTPIGHLIESARGRQSPRD